MNIVAVEGQVFAGKSSLVGQLRRLPDCLAVDEYAELGPLPEIPFESEAAAASSVDALLELERVRRARVLSVADPESLVLVDRSVLSVLACHDAHRALNLPSAWSYACVRVRQALEADSVIVPDAVVLLSVGEGVARAREKTRGPMIDFFMRSQVRGAMSRFYRVALPSSCRRVLRLSGEADRRQLVDAVSAFSAAVHSFSAEDARSRDCRRHQHGVESLARIEGTRRVAS
jgi:thymidylate kinase